MIIAKSSGLLDEMKKDPGAEKLLEREDLKSMYSAATQARAERQGLKLVTQYI